MNAREPDPRPDRRGRQGHPGAPDALHFGDWVRERLVALGYPAIAGHLAEKGLPKREVFRKWLADAYPTLRDLDRAYATSRAFVDRMHRGDRLVAIEGWTARQEQRVLFHGWARVEGSVELAGRSGHSWPLIRPAFWVHLEVLLRVDAVREATGLDSSTYPIHRIDGMAFRRLVELAEETWRSEGRSQLALELKLPNNGFGQQEIL